VLILRTQSILFDRHSEELQPYKYAGYPMLIKVRHLCTPDSIEGNIFVYENQCLELTNPCGLNGVPVPSVLRIRIRDPVPF
jgi:hypothetical protein